MAPLAAMLFETSRNRPDPTPDQGSQYDFPLFKAFANARRYAEIMARESSEANREPLLKEVPVPDALSPEERTAYDWARCEALLEQCRTLRISDPEILVLTASFAVSLAERIGAVTAEATAAADLQARAWGELGNARRVADDFAGAESDLARAMEQAGRGSGDPLLLARLMDLTASLYTDQRRFDDARRLLDLVYMIYEHEGDAHGAARTLISKGISSGYAFHVEEAIQLLCRGLKLLDGSHDPRLVLVAIHNLTWCLVECGRATEADRIFRQSRRLFAHHAEHLDIVKAHWLEGRIAAGIGNDEYAENRFLVVRAHFEKAQLPYDVALVSLDIAALWLRSGRTAEIRELIEQTITIFQTRKIRREAIGMLIVLREALRRDRATEALLRTIASKLLRLEEPLTQTSRARS
jgi:tetratricopeptide (TPR) repeat protein